MSASTVIITYFSAPEKKTSSTNTSAAGVAAGRQCMSLGESARLRGASQSTKATGIPDDDSDGQESLAI